ncbi:MAG: molybdenum cofactor biosynthesis protein MoaE [Gemmatimonadaceae bacterium]
MSGHAGRAALVSEPIDVEALVESVRSAAFGAVVTFMGTVRETSGGRTVSGLEYSAYTGMASQEMDAIVREAIAISPGCSLVAVHRIGDVPIGDVCVVIAAAHAHRAAAFDACRYCIDEIKKRVPIWKREQFADGASEWVNS